MSIKDCQEKKAARAEVCAVKLPKYLQALEKILEQNGSTGKWFCSRRGILRVLIIPSGFYVGHDMTIADLAVWRLLGWIFGGALDGIPQEILQSYTQIYANFKTMDENPKIKCEQISQDQVRAYMKEKYKHHFSFL